MNHQVKDSMESILLPPYLLYRFMFVLDSVPQLGTEGKMFITNHTEKEAIN